jgi:hypothetical protein
MALRGLVCAVQPRMQATNCFDLAGQFLGSEEAALIREDNPHLLQIGESGLTMGIKADLDGTRTFCRLFPGVYLGHFSSSIWRRLDASTAAPLKTNGKCSGAIFPGTHTLEPTRPYDETSESRIAKALGLPDGWRRIRFEACQLHTTPEDQQQGERTDETRNRPGR